MGILDKVTGMFGKHEEQSLPPLDGPSGFASEQSFSSGQFSDHGLPTQSFPGQTPPSAPPFNPNTGGSPSGMNLDHNPSFPEQPDPRMKMPLGETMRQRPQVHESSENPIKKDIELISAKLDYLKASLDSVNQRLANIENMARQETNHW